MGGALAPARTLSRKRQRDRHCPPSTMIVVCEHDHQWSIPVGLAHIMPHSPHTRASFPIVLDIHLL